MIRPGPRSVRMLICCAGAATATFGVGAPGAAAGAPHAAATAGDASAITVRRSRFGPVIFGERGRALYLFTRERSTRPRCYSACAEAWPPFLVERRPRAGPGARSSLIGTTRRRDGARQATYRGHPLYFYVGDTQPGQILCQDVFEFGGTWLIVSPRGRAVR